MWLAPRNVDATLTAADGESEKYLFYRGIGRMRAPFRVTTNRQARELSIYANFDEVLTSDETAHVPAMWLVDIREDGTSAFRQLPGVDVRSNTARLSTATSYEFDQEDYSAGNVKRLKSSMHAALTSDGLYDDEATARLETWNRAYFVSPGLRLFFLVPRSWTDYRLPLSISKSAQIQRVMIGRIQLITDQQRATLSQLAATTVRTACG